MAVVVCWWWWGFGLFLRFCLFFFSLSPLTLLLKWKSATQLQSFYYFYFIFFYTSRNYFHFLTFSPIAITKNHFNFHYVVGRGGFGKVWKVEKKKTKKLYAMKEMSKARIMLKRSVNSVMNERKLLANLKHPFLVNMSYAFQD